MGLDQSEVEWYITTGSDEGLNSFQILNNAKKEPAIILVEPRHIYNQRHLSSDGTAFIGDYRLDDNPGIDKGLWLKQWAEENKGKMTLREYVNFRASGDAGIITYSTGYRGDYVPNP